MQDWEYRKLIFADLAEAGGVVMPSNEIELVRPLDELLSVETGCFVGLEKPGVIGDKIFGFTPNHPAWLDLIAMGGGPECKGWPLLHLWLDDERVTKLADFMFYPVPRDQPWKINRTIGPDTFGITHWDDCHPILPQRELAEPLGVIMVGNADAARKTIACDSHLSQSVSIGNIVYESVRDPDISSGLAFAKFAAKGCRRVLIVPSDHALHPATFEVHAKMPADCVATSPMRLFSADKLFRPNPHFAFPFEIFERYSVPTAGANEPKVRSFPSNYSEGGNYEQRRATICPSVKLCGHPVNEKT